MLDIDAVQPNLHSCTIETRGRAINSLFARSSDRRATRVFRDTVCIARYVQVCGTPAIIRIRKTGTGTIQRGNSILHISDTNNDVYLNVPLPSGKWSRTPRIIKNAHEEPLRTTPINVHASPVRLYRVAAPLGYSLLATSIQCPSVPT